MTYTPAQQQALAAAANLATEDCAFSQHQVHLVAAYGMRQKAAGILYADMHPDAEAAYQLRVEADALAEMHHG